MFLKFIKEPAYMFDSTYLISKEMKMLVLFPHDFPKFPKIFLRIWSIHPKQNLLPSGMISLALNLTYQMHMSGIYICVCSFWENVEKHGKVVSFSRQL